MKEKTVDVPVWQLKEIDDTLRMVANTLHSVQRETCLDRNVMRSWNYVRDLIIGYEPSSEEQLKYYVSPGQIPKELPK